MMQAVARFYQSTVPGANRGKAHTVPDKNKDVGSLSELYRKAKVHIENKEGREVKRTEDIPPDVVGLGWKHLFKGDVIKRWWDARLALPERSTLQKMANVLESSGTAESSEVRERRAFEESSQDQDEYGLPDDEMAELAALMEYFEASYISSESLV